MSAAAIGSSRSCFMFWSATHIWTRHHAAARPGFWYVCATAPFCRSADAIVDDFGTLVEVSP